MRHVTALRLLFILAVGMLGTAVADAHDGSAHPPGLSEAEKAGRVEAM